MSLLVVEDDEVYGPALVRALVRAGYDARLARGVDEAAAVAAEARPTLAVVDLKLPDGSGVDVVRDLARTGCRTVLLTGHGSIRSAVEGMKAGAWEFLTKPTSTAEIVDVLREAAAEDDRADGPVERLEDVERDHILRVLDECGNNVTAAARRLGMYRRTLQRKLAKLDRR